MKSCTHPLWRTTRKHIQEARRLWCGVHGSSESRLIWMPVKALRRAEWLDFRHAQDDYKGGRPHVLRIAKAMCQRVPMPPAVGYYTNDGIFVLWDGNHRASAAKIAGVEKMPVVVCGKRKSK